MPAVGRNPSSGLPSGSAALVAEAQNYFSAGDYDKAEADYRQILQRDPNNALALANLATIEMQENKLADAETHITAALAQNPDDAYDLSTLGYLKFRQQKYDEALDALSRAATLDPAEPANPELSRRHVEPEGAAQAGGNGVAQGDSSWIPTTARRTTTSP